MWMLFHRKAGTKAVADGRSFLEECPTCERRTRFHEVEVSESYGVWFVDVIGDKERAYRCAECGDTFDLRDQAPANNASRKTAAPPTKTGVDRVEALAAEQRRRDAAAQARRAEIETRLDDELAELKKRMGK